MNTTALVLWLYSATTGQFIQQVEIAPGLSLSLCRQLVETKSQDFLLVTIGADWPKGHPALQVVIDAPKSVDWGIGCVAETSS